MLARENREVVINLKERLTNEEIQKMQPEEKAFRAWAYQQSIEARRKEREEKEAFETLKREYKTKRNQRIVKKLQRLAEKLNIDNVLVAMVIVLYAVIGYMFVVTWLG